MSTYRVAVVRSDAPVADDDVLVFDETDGTWVPSEAPTGGSDATGNTHTSSDATRPALPAGTVWLSTAATRPATMLTGDIWIGEPL